MVDPRQSCVDGVDLMWSFHARSPIGDIARDDVLLSVSSGRVLVGVVNRFFDRDGELYFQTVCFQRAAPDNILRAWSDWVTSTPETIFVPLSDARANVMWARRNPSVIRIVVPPFLKLD